MLEVWNRALSFLELQEHTVIGLLVGITLITILSKCVWQSEKINLIWKILILIVILFLPVLISNRWIASQTHPTPQDKIGIWFAKFQDDSQNHARRIRKELESHLLSEEQFDIRDMKVVIFGELKNQFKRSEKIGEKKNAKIIVFGEVSGGELIYNLSIIGHENLFSKAELPNFTSNKSMEIKGSKTDANNIYELARPLLGLAFYEKKDYQKATAIFNECLDYKIPIKKEVLYYYLGDCAVNLNEDDKAVEYYNESISQNAYYAPAYYNLGDIYRKKGESERDIQKKIQLYEKAYSCYESTTKITKDDPSFAPAWLARAVIKRKLNDPLKALSYINVALNLQPKYVAALANKGAAFAELKEYESAIKFLDEAIAINPDYIDAIVQKSEYLIRLSKFDEASKILQKAFELDKNYHTAWSVKGLWYLNQGKYQEAIKSGERSISLNPDQDFAYFIIGDSYYAMGDYNKAEMFLDKGIKFGPLNEGAWHKKGNIALYQRDFQKSIKCGNYPLKTRKLFQENLKSAFLIFILDSCFDFKSSRCYPFKFVTSF